MVALTVLAYCGSVMIVVGSLPVDTPPRSLHSVIFFYVFLGRFSWFQWSFGGCSGLPWRSELCVSCFDVTILIEGGTILDENVKHLKLLVNCTLERCKISSNKLYSRASMSQLLSDGATVRAWKRDLPEFERFRRTVAVVVLGCQQAWRRRYRMMLCAQKVAGGDPQKRLDFSAKAKAFEVSWQCLWR